jgi:ERCC4-type nuclease
MATEPTIIIDTREKKPFLFKAYKTRNQKLTIGDYSVVGYAKRISVEYKSVPDFLSWINPYKPKRFISQVNGLLEIEYACVVVGGRIDSRSKYSNMSLSTVLSVVGHLAALNIPVIFANNRRIAEQFICTFLTESIRNAKRRDLYSITH